MTTDAEMLAVRPMMEQIAAMGDCIGQQTVKQIRAISQRAAAWLAENPPGQPVVIEPRGCPTPGACSCVMPSTRTALSEPEPVGPTDEELLELERIARDLQWCARGWEPAAMLVGNVRASEIDKLCATFLARWSRPAPQPVPVSERLPGAEDMTEDGEVWIEDPGHDYPLADDYDWEPHKWILRPIGKFDAKNGLRWLPAHALPLPGEVEHG